MLPQIAWSMGHSEVSGLNGSVTCEELLLAWASLSPCMNCRPISGGKDVAQLWVSAGLNDENK